MVTHHVRPSRSREASFLAKKMLLWNGACATVATVVYITERVMHV